MPGWTFQSGISMSIVPHDHTAVPWLNPDPTHTCVVVNVVWNEGVAVFEMQWSSIGDQDISDQDIQQL